MRKISLYIAMSLDGYIADNKGGVNWLKGQDENDNTNKSYSEFIEKIDTIIMGWNTYHHLLQNSHRIFGHMKIKLHML